MKLFYYAMFFFPILFSFNDQVMAQVIPDNTLGNENSTIDSVDSLSKVIEGGAIRGDNLFHSFQEFSIQEGLSVNFANPGSISNIFSRVTGGNISEIFGSLGVEGAANLFLMNPNGIIFGENATINVNGSFLATTAQNVKFSDGSRFHSFESDNTILTVNFPVGLGFGNISDNPSTININGIGHNLNVLGGSLGIRENSTGENLTSLPTKTFALVGNEINFDGGVLVSPSGNIELGSVREGQVLIEDFDINNGSFRLGYRNVELFGDISFANRSLLDTSSPPNNSLLSGGSIALQGKNIFSQDGSVILNQNFGESNSNSINIFASDSFQISGTDPIARILGGIRTESLSEGNGANIEISTPQLLLINGGSIQTYAFSSFSNTSSGNINLDVSDLQILGASPLTSTAPSNITTFTFNTSQAGDISLNSDTVNIEEGGTIVSSGILGAVGEITINATENLRINSFQPESLLSSSINSINSSSPIPGRININSPNIFIGNGGIISTSTFAGGSAGDIVINANNIEITGKIEPQSASEERTSSNINSSTAILDQAFLELVPDTIDISDFSDLPLSGNSGFIEINTDSIKIENEGHINVFNQGTGDAGNLILNANSIFLDNGGEILASTTSGEGGNITLNSDSLQLTDQSLLTVSAGGSGNGGNITINSNTILGIENSDIIANAVAGSGGNITIDSDAILGLEERSQPTPFGDITASSEFGIDGTVNINSPNNNLKRDVFSAFRNYASPRTRALLKSRCLNPRNSKGKLLYVGRSGIPENPDNFFDDDEIAIVDSVIQTKQRSQNPDQSQVWVEGDPIIDSNSIKMGKDGKIFLVAETNLENASSKICSDRK